LLKIQPITIEDKESKPLQPSRLWQTKENISMSNYSTILETPVTGVDLDWGTVPTKWHREVKALYLSFKDNEFSKFFYQTDVALIRLLCEQHSMALKFPDEMTAAGWKAIYEQWDKFGTTMKSRAQVRFTIAKSQVAEDYSKDINDVIDSTFDGDDD
jgi:hypothetical protein